MHQFQSIADIEMRFKVVEELMDSKFIETNKKRSHIFFPIWYEFY
jgi:hypothetical protein